jgi:regulator of sigma E protease
MNLGILHTALVFILVFTVLVFFHELGHFLTAKLFRMKVHEFGFGLPLPGTKRLFRFAFDGETEYTVWPFLFGGFVRIAGMEIDYAESPKDKAIEETNEEHPETAPRTPHAVPDTEIGGTTNLHALRQETAEVDKAEPDGFNSRPIYQRFLVILAGPVFSFLLGWLALCSIGFTTGFPDKTLLTVHQDPAPNTIAYAAGLRVGDALTGFNGKTAADSDEVLKAIHESAGKELTLTIRSENGKTRTISVIPKGEKVAGTDKLEGRLGFIPEPKPLTYRRVSVAESFERGNNMVGLWFSTMGKLLASGAIKDNVGGPVAIAKETHSAAKSGGMATLGLLGQLSLSLGLFNLFPIPVLDGGHLSLMLVEAIRRRKLTAEQQGRVLATGFAILAVLFVLIMFKDITGLFRRG